MNWLLALGAGCLVVAAVPYAAVLLVGRVVNPSGSPARKAAYEPTVSVVVQTYDEARIVTQKLEDVFALDYPTLGSRESLGPLQPGYALLDAQVVRLVASVRLVRGPSEAVWKVESELRNHYGTAND